MGSSSLCSRSSRVFRISSVFFFLMKRFLAIDRGYFFEGTILYLEPCQTGRLLDVCHPEWSDSITVEDTVCD